MPTVRASPRPTSYALRSQAFSPCRGSDPDAKGDLVEHRGHWYAVVRVNPKTVSVHMHPGASWTNTIGYHEISGHRPASAAGLKAGGDYGP
jgi:hypothetical protein